MSSISTPELQKPSAFARLGALFCSLPLLIAFGWLNVGLGSVGAILPVMPTTVFMLMALWAFSKSSPRFHRWLYTHPRFGPVLQDWQQERAIPGPAKALALTMMAVEHRLARRVQRPLCRGAGGLNWIGGACALHRYPGTARLRPSKQHRPSDSRRPVLAPLSLISLRKSELPGWQWPAE